MDEDVLETAFGHHSFLLCALKMYLGEIIFTCPPEEQQAAQVPSHSFALVLCADVSNLVKVVHISSMYM